MIDLSIGLAPWIVSDGNYKYSDFRCGEIAEFAVRFHLVSAEEAPERQKAIHSLGNCRYKVVAEVVYHSAEAWIIDFGVCVYNECAAPKFKIGDFVSAEVYLGIDPFFYFEQLWKLPDMLPLVYKWQVDTTIRQTAPLIQKRDGNRWREADSSKYFYEEVDLTKPEKTISEAEAIEVWETTSTEFILNCTLTDAKARFPQGKSTDKNHQHSCPEL